jgi:hypothetical protein
LNALRRRDWRLNQAAGENRHILYRLERRFRLPSSLFRRVDRQATLPQVRPVNVELDAFRFDGR